ncbi:hypothetical protein BC826DRAFT_129985 [Russula brevipes]|nr:hypothetical protein BC826DRAFT_129985 [Russula brevipes]
MSSYFPGDGNMMRPTTLDTHLTSTVGTMPGWSPKSHAHPRHVGHRGGLTTPHGGYMLASQGQVLESVLVAAKRQVILAREENGGTTCGPRKKFKGNMGINGVLVAAGHASRAHQRLPGPQKNKDKFEAAERGAGTLAIPNVQEVCHSFDRAKRPGVGRHNCARTAGGEGSGQGIPEATERGLIQIPRRLGKVHKALLQASSADWACGFVRTIKCQLCPSADFGHWEDYKRHCMYMEAHPLSYYFATTAETSSQGRMRWIGTQEPP